MSILRFFYRGFQYMISGVPNHIVNVNVASLASSDLLKGRCALITGGTSGIGFEIAKAFINAGGDGCNYRTFTGQNRCSIVQAEKGEIIWRCIR